ncbi:Serine/threonine-protein phosphatase T [Entamoeba marina]
MSTYRQQGGELFKKGEFMKAISVYNKAILDEPDIAVHYSNRAICYIKIELYGAALTDSEKCITLDPKFAKGYYRKASAHAALGQFDEAIKASEQAKKLQPQDKLIGKLLKSLKEKRREQLFMEAIAVDEEIIKFTWKELDASDAKYELKDDRCIDGVVAKELFDLMQQSCEYGKCSVHLRQVLRIIEEAKAILENRCVLQEIETQNEKMTVVGDIHGQFFDLVKLFEINGLPSETNKYLFNGDFVDRGSFGVECVIALFSFMIAYPNSVYLARGNHETKAMNSMYGFDGEVNAKLGEKASKAFSDVFTQLPYCHVIDHSIFVVHGGIPPSFISLDDIKKIKRGIDPKENSPESALLWADPQTSNGSAPSIRGTGRSFGPDITRNFLEGNGLKYIIRSHEMKMNGYEWGAEGHLLTVFSAPNYCDQMNNKGAFVKVSFENKSNDVVPTLDVVTFNASPHPNVPAMAYARSFGNF